MPNNYYVNNYPECKECGSINSEEFIRAKSCGIRCLDCDHELIHIFPDDHPDINKQYRIHIEHTF